MQVKHNDIEVTLTRIETERVKEGRDAVQYWTIELAQLDGAKDKDGKLVKPMQWLESLNTLLGDQLREKLQQRLNADLKGAQMDNGKDKYNMDAKLKLATTYITNGFGANRTTKKSPEELALAEHNTALAALRAQVTAGTLTAHAAKKVAAELSMAFMAKMQAAAGF